MTQFSALQTARSVRTRRLAAAEENLEVARAARLAQIFKEICDGIISYKGALATRPPDNRQCCGSMDWFYLLLMLDERIQHLSLNYF